MDIAFQQVIPVLRIFSVDKAHDFYVNYLGFSVDWQHQFDDVAPHYLQISRAGMTLHLTEHHGDCCPGATVFVWMTGIELYHHELTGKQYGDLKPTIQRTFYDSLCLVVTDPFGNRIRFNERCKTPECIC
jgi:hypothetical protein